MSFFAGVCADAGAIATLRQKAANTSADAARMRSTSGGNFMAYLFSLLAATARVGRATVRTRTLSAGPGDRPDPLAPPPPRLTLPTAPAPDPRCVPVAR